MEQIRAFTRRWGNSIAVVIPAEVIGRQNIKENEEITILMGRKHPNASEFFGLASEWKRSTQEIKDEIREGWLSDSDREREKKWKKK